MSKTKFSLKIFFLYFFLFLNGKGHAATTKMEQDYRDDARLKVSQAAQVFNSAVDAYEKAGPKAFAESFNGILNPEEKTFVIKELKTLPTFPKLKMRGDTLIVFYKKEIIAELDSYEVAQGNFEGGPFHYSFDNELGLIENIQNWKSLDKKSAQIDHKNLRFLMNLFIPQAEARMTNKAAIPLMICGPLLGALVGYWLAKPSNSPKIAQSQNYLPENNSTSVATHGDGNEGKSEGKAKSSRKHSAKRPVASGSKAGSSSDFNAVERLSSRTGSSSQVTGIVPEQSAILTPNPSKQKPSSSHDDLIAVIEQTFPTRTPKAQSPNSSSETQTQNNKSTDTNLYNVSSSPGIDLSPSQHLSANGTMISGGSNSTAIVNAPTEPPSKTETNTPTLSIGTGVNLGGSFMSSPVNSGSNNAFSNTFNLPDSSNNLVINGSGK